MAGGGGFQKKIINFVIDNPEKVYLGGAAFLYFYRTYATQQAYNYHFGKIDFMRKLERGELKH
jgi:hypothetical protein